MQRVLGIIADEIALSVVLHLGTSLALLIFFFKDILNLLRNARTLLLIITVTIITGIIGILGKDFFESLFGSVKLVAVALIFTGIILLLTRKFMEAKRKNLNIKDAIILGITQGIAIIPGISRSGITISTLLFRKIDRETSFKFSFLASIPAVLGATLLEAKKIGFACQIEIKNFIVGFTFSLLTGLVSLRILSIILRKAKLYYFGYYCIFIALLVLLIIE
jgi:undecaprenyl-diphosphatase